MARRLVLKSNGTRQANIDVDIILQALLQFTGESWIREYKFHPARRWRFDYACPEHKVAIEIEGNLFAYGRHNRPMGMVRDMEKYGWATAMGWRVLRFTPPSTGEPLSRFGTEACWQMIGKTLAL